MIENISKEIKLLKQLKFLYKSQFKKRKKVNFKKMKFGDNHE